ncbi:YgiQ family radical SAM protein [Ruminiclostridium herbifermentans]|uniref:YgiQ family radical SAM protein n=1 Tax=Ruminiclostridium herbifermentans TaxID=2488810 RepID=A0A4U7JKZ4_9FIRM|nr:YgiQ family radical SAM protein [Ruminiclostridium herbifermentans]QNU68477.1 YgiQ family radical SAM protein [Ruminiclostridium herbifermentans]
MSFLPISFEDMNERGWKQLDFLYISGDAYVDHPSFGHAIITRVLESEGFKVGIIAQPNWKNSDDFKRLGRPKYGVLVSSGVIDSMVNHYTASKKKRSQDLYSPGGKAGLRPDRAVIVYANKIKEIFKDTPVIIGGIEASLRRFAHYDYWDDKVRRSILVDSKADLLLYGMGEKSIVEIANLLKKDIPITSIRNVAGSAYIARYDELPLDIKNAIDSKGTKKIAVLPSYDEVLNDKKAYAEAFKIQYNEQDAINGKILVQQHGDRYLVQNTPSMPMSVSELDRVYALPYERTYHPVYEKYGGVPAITEVEFSITSQRGCYGGCSFCALNFHQGRVIQKRSQASIINEAKKLTWLEGFKGYIHDVGGPTANFRNVACKKQIKHGVCKDRQCLYPEPCKNLIVDHTEYLSLLRKLRELPNVKKVFVRSGIRYDYLMYDKDDTFFRELCEHHVSGQLKVAPEHVVDRVLDKMGKSKRQLYDRFVKKFYDINKRINKEQYLVPYLMSSHPGSDLNAAVELAVYLKENHIMPEQVQDFYPTPGTLSTCMFYTGYDARNMKKVYVPKTVKEKAMQRALLQYRKKENYHIVIEALKEANREDLIGFGPHCLVKPLRGMVKANSDSEKSSKKQNYNKNGNKKKQEKVTAAHKKTARNSTLEKKKKSSSKLNNNEMNKNEKKVKKGYDDAKVQNKQKSTKQLTRKRR